MHIIQSFTEMKRNRKNQRKEGRENVVYTNARMHVTQKIEEEEDEEMNERHVEGGNERTRL